MSSWRWLDNFQWAVDRAACGCPCDLPIVTEAIGEAWWLQEWGDDAESIARRLVDEAGPAQGLVWLALHGHPQDRGGSEFEKDASCLRDLLYGACRNPDPEVRALRGWELRRMLGTYTPAALSQARRKYREEDEARAAAAEAMAAYMGAGLERARVQRRNADRARARAQRVAHALTRVRAALQETPT